MAPETSPGRFVEEAQVLAQLQHPNIVPIHELGVLEDGRLYFTMKEVQGRPLSDLIAAVHAAYDAFEYHTIHGEKLPRFRPNSLPPAGRLLKPACLFIPGPNDSIPSPPAQRALSAIVNHGRWLELIDALVRNYSADCYEPTNTGVACLHTLPCGLPSYASFRAHRRFLPCLLPLTSSPALDTLVTAGGAAAGSGSTSCSGSGIKHSLDRVADSGSTDKRIDARELKRALRSSGAITRMYDDSIRVFGLLVAAKAHGKVPEASRNANFEHV